MNFFYWSYSLVSDFPLVVLHTIWMISFNLWCMLESSVWTQMKEQPIRFCRGKLNVAPFGMPKCVWPSMNQYKMFSTQTSTLLLPSSMHCWLTKHGRCCVQINKLLTRSHIESDNCIVHSLFSLAGWSVRLHLQYLIRQTKERNRMKKELKNDHDVATNMKWRVTPFLGWSKSICNPEMGIMRNRRAMKTIASLQRWTPWTCTDKPADTYLP